MKAICDHCEHQIKHPKKAEAACGAADWIDKFDGYGEFKYGGKCIHDEDVSDMFKPREESGGEIDRLSAMIERLDRDRSSLRDEIRELKRRLTHIDSTESHHSADL